MRGADQEKGVFYTFQRKASEKYLLFGQSFGQSDLMGRLVTPLAHPPAPFDQVIVVLCIISCIVLVNVQCIRERVLPNEYYLFIGPVRHSI